MAASGPFSPLMSLRMRMRRAPIETLTVDDLVFRVRWSARRASVGITVARDGGLTIAAPPRTSVAALEAVSTREASVGAPQTGGVRRPRPRDRPRGSARRRLPAVPRQAPAGGASRGRQDACADAPRPPRNCPGPGRRRPGRRPGVVHEAGSGRLSRRASRSSPSWSAPRLTASSCETSDGGDGASATAAGAWSHYTGSSLRCHPTSSIT